MLSLLAALSSGFFSAVLLLLLHVCLMLNGFWVCLSAAVGVKQVQLRKISAAGPQVSPPCVLTQHLNPLHKSLKLIKSTHSALPSRIRICPKQRQPKCAYLKAARKAYAQVARFGSKITKFTRLGKRTS